MAKNALTVNLHIEGATETLAAFRRLPKDANRELRRRSKELTQALVPTVQAAARADLAPQSRLLAPTVRALSDRVPAISAGGSKRVGSRSAPAWKVLFGSEFGSDQFGQFHRRHRGRKGAWFFATVEREADTIAAAWSKAADDIVRSFSRGGGS